MLFPTEKVLSDEVKRKQYDLGFDPKRGGTGEQQFYRAGTANIDPEDFFRRIFGEFVNFRDSFFEERPEVGRGMFVNANVFIVPSS